MIFLKLCYICMKNVPGNVSRDIFLLYNIAESIDFWVSGVGSE